MVVRQIAILLLLIAATAFPLSAQTTGTLTGRVVDSEGEPIIGAFARLLPAGSGGGLSKAPDGRFLISNIPAGDYTLEVSWIGYRKVTRMIRIAGGQTTNQGTVDLGELQELRCESLAPIVIGQMLVFNGGTVRIIQGRDLW